MSPALTPLPTSEIKWGDEVLRLPREIREGHRIVKAIGEGTYGKVFLAKNLSTNDDVAIKILSLSRRSDGIPATTIKEVSLLKDLKHENIVELRSVSLNVDCFALIFEACETDLGHILDMKIRKEAYMSRRVVRDLLFQLLQAVAYVHSKGILHRDIKPQNILLSNNETKIKLGDFGLACLTNLSTIHEQKNCSAITLWYRPPELLLGYCGYSTAADVWSVGCVFAEMLLTRTILNATTEVGQLRRIFAMARLPPNLLEVFPDIEKLPFLYDVVYRQGPRLEQLLPLVADRWSVDLLMRMLEIDPTQRISAERALMHPYFQDPTAAAHICSFRPGATPSQFEKSVNNAIPRMRPFMMEGCLQSVEALFRSEAARIAWETEQQVIQQDQFRRRQQLATQQQNGCCTITSNNNEGKWNSVHQHSRGLTFHTRN